MLPLIAIRRDPLSKADHVDSLFRRTFLLEWKVGQVVEGSLEQHLVKNRQMKYCTQVEIEWTRWWKWSSDSGLLLLVRAACGAMPSCFARPGVGSSFCLASCSKRFHVDVSWCFKSSSTTRYFQNVSSKVLVLRCTMLECAVGHFKDPKALFHRHYLLFRPRWLVCLLILLSNYQRLTHSLSHLLNNQSMNHSTVNNQKFHPSFHDSQWASIVLQVFYALKFQPITCPRLASFFLALSWCTFDIIRSFRKLSFLLCQCSDWEMNWGEARTLTPWCPCWCLHWGSSQMWWFLVPRLPKSCTQSHDAMYEHCSENGRSMWLNSKP